MVVIKFSARNKADKETHIPSFFLSELLIGHCYLIMILENLKKK